MSEKTTVGHYGYADVGGYQPPKGRATVGTQPAPSVPLPVLQELVAMWRLAATKNVSDGYKVCLSCRADELEAVIRAHQPGAGT